MESQKPYNPSQSGEIESTDLYRRACSLSDEVWEAVKAWDWYSKTTVGIQLVKAVDSLPANMVEGDGRGHEQDALRFLMIGRASAREARHWLGRAVARKLLTSETSTSWLDELTQLIKMLQGIVRYRERRAGSVKEERKPYANNPREVADDDWICVDAAFSDPSDPLIL